MNNGTARPGYDHQRAAALVATAITDHDEIIQGIEGLRALGEPGAAALEAVLAIPSVRKMMLSWQLVEAMADGENVDMEAHLIDLLGYEHATHVRGVLFPVEENKPPTLKLVQG